MAKKTKTMNKQGADCSTNAASTTRREQVLDALRVKGIDQDTLWTIRDQLFAERKEAELNAARLFYAVGEKITEREFSDQLSDARCRCNGVLVAAMGVAQATNDKEMSNGLIQLIDDLLGHLRRIECAFNAEIWQAWTEAKAK
jgi:hypothetical protein